MEKVVLIGAGPHAKVIADMLLQMPQYEVVGLIDPEIKMGFMGLKILGNDDCLDELFNEGVHKAFVSIGSNEIRKKVFYKVKEIGFEMINIISANAIVSSYAKLGQGIAIMPGAIVNAFTQIKDGCILNTNCSIDHDGSIDEFVHVAPGSAIAGSVSIGEKTFCGVGTRIIDGIKVGNNVVIGAGSVVIKDIKDDMKVVGIPATPIDVRENKNE